MGFRAIAVVLAAGAGLFLPGYLVARLLGERRAWLLALPISLVVLFHCVFWTGLVAPVRFATVAISVVAVNLLLAAALRWWGRPTCLPHELQVPRAKPHLRWTCVAIAGGVAGLLVVQAVLNPLLGADTFFRWDFLAERVLATGRFDFYPPVAAADFRNYGFIDGFPPVVSFAYWWLYAAAGSHAPRLTAIAVVPQYLAVLALVWRLAEIVMPDDRRGAAGPIAAATLAGAVTFFRAVVIGQETGLTALAVVSVLYVILSPDARDSRGPGPAILVGLCAALGPLSREYGWAFVAVGGVAMVLHRWRWRSVAVFGFVAVVAAGPWYVRTWLLTGNPFYSLHVGALPANPVIVDLMESYRDVNGVSHWTRQDWWRVALHLIEGAWLPLTLGAGGVAVLARRWPALAVAVVASVALWLVAAGYTSGGPFNSTRVLAPALAVLSVGAGVLMARWRPSSASFLVTLAAAYACLAACVYPFAPHDMPAWEWRSAAFRPYTMHKAARRLAAQLPRALPEGGRLLSDDAFLHAAAVSTGVEIVPPWSPEVRFLFDPAMDARHAAERLVALGIAGVEFDANGVNAAFLKGRCAFYRDRDGWNPILRDGDMRVFLLAVPTTPAGSP